MSVSLRYAAVLLVLIACPIIAAADEWSATPSIQLRGSHDDNIGLATTDPVSVWGSSVSPLLDLRKRTASGLLALGGRVTFNRYSNDSIRDTNVQLLKFSGRSSTRLDRFSFTGTYKRDTTVATITDTTSNNEVDGDETPVDAGDVDSNLVQAIVRRNRLSFRPSWNRTLSRTMSMSLGYSLNDTRFSEDAGTSLVDYRRQGVSASLAGELSRQDSWNTGVSFSRYDAPDRGSETEDYDISAGFTREFSPLLRGDVSLGFRTSTTSLGDEEVVSSGSSFNLNLVRKGSERTTYRLYLERELYPSGAGTVVLSDNIRVNYGYDVSPLLTFSAWLAAFRNKSLDFFSENTDRKYYSIEPGFRWRLTRLWSVNGSYRYRWQKYDNQDGAAESNAVFLAVNYAWPTMAVSR